MTAMRSFAFACAAILAGSTLAPADQTITIDGQREGRRFDGIGAVSGGGATSRFLIEYPEPQRSQILDYLFKPNFGASLQVLYVEIGSDKNGTQGSEPAHARSRDEMEHPKPEYFERGYEWWLMKEAKKRNPDIRFDATAWNSPLWVGVRSGGFWSQDMADYYVSWIKGAKSYHGLDVNFTGCRNESGVNLPWVKLYRKTLDNAGLKNVTIHAFDNWRPENKWLFAKDLATDQELNNAVGIIGNHVTWKGAPEGVSPSPDYVLNSGKPIWDTEEHVYQDGFGSAINKVRACNENYIDNKVTSTVFWHLISAFYKIEGWYGKHAMAIASSPWSGNYTLMPELWGHAHTCQFTKIGWKYLDGEGCGYFKGGGSYVTYKSPDSANYTIVIETKNAKADQAITFNITGGLPTGKVSVWKSDPAAMFQKQDDIAPQNGAVAITLKPGSIYTITTTTGQQKGAHRIPPADKPFPFPYHENYDHYARSGVLPYYQSDIQGVFEVANRADGKGKCLQSVVKFSNTKTTLDGLTVLGDATWKDYQVSVDVSLGEGSAALLGRVSDTRGKSPKGYILKLGKDGNWQLSASADGIASGHAEVASQPWHNLKLVFEGTTIKGFIDGKEIASVTNNTYAAGMTGLGTCMSAPLFDNLIVSEIHGAVPPPTSFAHDGEPETISVPCRAALDRAAVSLSDISNIGQKGLVVGNGELNAIVYSSGSDLRLRLAKNDCWDVRVDTKSDPPLPMIDPAAGTSSGHGAVESWKAPYPTALPCAELVLEAKDKSAVTSAKLDLAKAAAIVKTTTDAMDVRVLAQTNVILIRSDRELSILGSRQFLKNKDVDKWVSLSDTGTEDGCIYLHQNIPGDEDVSGMDVHVVAARKDGLLAVAVTTTRDCQHPLEDGIKRAKQTLADADAVAKHEAIWRQFWSRSGIELGDTELQNWWYRMVYFFRVFSRADGNAVGLAACFNNLAGWHNSLKLNYNIQQTYLAAAPVNHPELLEPFIDVLTRALPRGRWFAATSFKGAEGAFFFSDFYPFEPDPAKCVTPYKHQQSYMPWGYTWGMAGHLTVVVWDYYRFSPTPQHLERVYPLIKEFGTFYCSILEKCPLVNGKRRMGPSFFPELGGYKEFNTCYDIAFITAALRIARDAATLRNDSAMLARINAVIDQVPDFGTQTDPDQGNQTVIEQWSGARFNEGADRHGTMVMSIFPAGVINWFSSEPLKELGKRTINRVEKSTTHANSNVTINVARARLGLGAEAITNAKMCFSSNSKHSPEQPNGLFSWKGHGFYMTEQVAIARLVSELLLQSEGGIIRIFPAWPADTDARFANLLAEGGFEVSAEQVGGRVGNVRIQATVTGTAKLLSPWPGGVAVVEKDSGAAVPVNIAPGWIASFSTSAGMTYLLKPAH